MKNDNGIISQIGQQSGTRANQPTSGLAVTPDGSYFVQWDRRYSNSSASPKIALYHFDGTTSTLVAQSKISGPGAYTQPALTDDGMFVAADGVILVAKSGVLSPATVLGDSIHVNKSGVGSIVETVWNEANQTFYELSAKYGLYETKRQSDGTWVRTLIESTSSLGAFYQRLSVSKDGSTLVYARVNNSLEKYIPFRVFKRDSLGNMVFAGQAGLASHAKSSGAISQRERIYQGHFAFNLSANDGRYLLYADKGGNIIFYDTMQIENGKFISDGKFKPNNSIATSKQSSIYTHISTLPSGLILISNWRNTVGYIEIWKTKSQ